MRLLPLRLRVRPRLLGALGLSVGLTLAVAACDAAGDRPSSATPPSGGPPPPGIVLRISYDETSVTTGTQWPGGIVDGGRTVDDEYLIHYSSTRQAFQFNDQGDLASQTEYLEGNASTWLPADFHEAVEDDLPVPGGADPVTRYELQGGTFRALRASGAVAFSKQFEADAFRIPAEWVAAIEAAQDPALDVAPRVARHRQGLQDLGVTFREIEGNRAVVEQPADGGLTVRTVVNLQTGLAEVVESVRADGRRESAEVRNYEFFGVTPVATRVVSYHYGEASGAWGVDRKTELTRTNVVVNR